MSSVVEGGLLRGKRTIVIGASSGIGAATVRHFARHGADVVAMSRHEAACAAVVQECRDLDEGQTVTAMACDATRQSDVVAAVDAAVEFLGGLDCLAVLAGNVEVRPAEQVDQAHIDYIFGVNVNGTLFANAAAIRHLKHGGGSIINYSAGSGLDGFPGMPVYSAAKGAVLAYTRTVAREWGRYGVRVNAVAPAIATPGMQRFKEALGPGRARRAEANVGGLIPLGGQLGVPGDAADLNVFLASDLSRFITGQTIPVDGGYARVR